MKKYEGICELDYKYFMADISIEVPCPNCGSMNTWDLDGTHIEYPKFNVVDTMSFECEECECEFEVPYKLIPPTVKVEIYDEDIKQLK